MMGDRLSDEFDCAFGLGVRDAGRQGGGDPV
jgi:hypothetical protein